MRIFFTGLLAAVIITSFATTAEARRGGGASTEKLVFVSTTKFTDEGGPLSVCHLVKTQSALFINFWRSLSGYALASNNCDADSYYDLDAADLAEGQALGMIPADIPAEPSMSMATIAGGFWGLGVAGLFGLFGLLKVQQTAARRKKRLAFMGTASPAGQAILDAMCHAAKADGYVDDAEIVEIQHAAEQMTGETFSTDNVRQMARLAETDIDQKACKRLIQNRRQEERLVMMKGVLSVVAADGILGGKEKAFVGRLADAMKMPPNMVNDLLNDVVSEAAARK